MIIQNGYFSSVISTTRLSIHEDPSGQNPLVSQELALPPMFEPKMILHFLHFLLEPFVLRGKPPLGESDMESYARERSKKYWLVYEFSAAKEASFACAIHLSYEETEKLVAPGETVLAGWEGSDSDGSENVPFDEWGSTTSGFLIDPDRTGE